MRHEVAHIALGHNEFQLDIELAEDGTDEHARAANRQAREWLMQAANYTELLRLGEGQLYQDKAEAFATTSGYHPGIVIGRLKHDAIGEWPGSACDRWMGIGRGGWISQLVVEFVR